MTESDDSVDVWKPSTRKRKASRETKPDDSVNEGIGSTYIREQERRDQARKEEADRETKAAWKAAAEWKKEAELKKAAQENKEAEKNNHDWPYDYPEDDCEEFNGKYYFVTEDYSSYTMKMKVAKAKYMHLEEIADLVKEYEDASGTLVGVPEAENQEWEDPEDEERWKEEEAEGWDRDKDGDLLIKIWKLELTDVITNDNAGIWPWAEDDGIDLNDISDG